MKNFLFILFLLFYFPAISQSQEIKDTINKKKPKIGLVLSGGGAKGMAHIGVLKVLEKYHIKPDYISGTSMGAIVGSLYAAGYSAEQIDSIFRKIDFDKTLFNSQERKYKSFFKKKTGPKFILSLPFSFQEMSVQIPKGLSGSQNMFNVMAHYLYPVHAIGDFNNLQIPFLCISTDITNGEQVVFNKGFLPEAVTASALLPTVYKPLDLNNTLLLDGGIVNNYPVQENKDMGAELIIGSDVQGKILKKDQIKDITNIMDQIVSFQMYKEMPKKRLMTDVYIHPDINGLGITDFENIDTIIHRGVTEAEKKISKIAHLYSDSNYVRKKLVVKFPDSIAFDEIQISGHKNYRRNYLLNKIGVETKRKISYKDFLEGINNLYGTENFEFVHYQFDKKNKKNILKLKVKEKEHNGFVNIGFHYNPLYKINVIGNMEKKYLFLKNDFFSFDIIGGEYTRYNLDYIIDNGFGWNIGWHTGYHRLNTNVDSHLFFDQNISINQLDLNIQQWSNQLSFQGTLKHSIYFTLGLNHQYKNYYTLVFSGANQDLPYSFNKNHYYGPFVRFDIDSRDDFDFPKKGIRLMLRWNYFPFSSNFYNDFHPFSFYKAEFDFTKKLFSSNIYLHTKLHAGLLYTKKATFDNYFYIGGNINYVNFENFEDFPVLEPLAINATKFSRASAVFDYNFLKKHHIETGGHYLIYDTSDNLWGENKKDIYGYSIAYAYESFLGPLRIIYSRSPKNKKHVLSINFGYVF
jgi:NTE family protein